MTDPARTLQLVSDPTSDARLGTVVDGRYVIERVLGQGGMGLVYAGRHQMLGRRLALKVLKPTVSSDADVIERFRREAQAASAIGSPHICDVSDFGALPDGSTYFVMEFLDGPSLSAAMEGGTLAEARALHVARQLTVALGAAHARGIVHRDLKPDNVHLVTQGGDTDFVKVLDFGIAKVGGTDSKLTQAGQVFGTPHYMSPEQCAGREVDARTDIYALGVLLYEMVCGKVPFDADNLMGVLTKHIYEQPIAPRELSPPASVSPGLEAVILRALAKNPDHRYGSMAAMETDLVALEAGSAPGALLDAMDGAARAGATTAPMPLTSVTHAAPTAPPTPTRSTVRWVVALAATLLFAGSVGTAALLWPDAPVATPPAPVIDDPGVPPAVVDTPPVTEPNAPPAAEVTTPSIVELRSDPPVAEVFDEDGTMLGNTPLRLPRPERGAARYFVEAPGHTRRALDIGAATGDVVTLSLAPEPTRPRVRHRTPPGEPVSQPASEPVEDPGVIDRLGDGLIDPFAEPRPRRAQPRTPPEEN
ncbi:MAG: protein kinase [Sandaracinaceae bacterium]